MAKIQNHSKDNGNSSNKKTNEREEENIKTQSRNQGEAPAVTKSGDPDMRISSNRNDPEKVAEYVAKKEEEKIEAEPGEITNKDGSPDLRVKSNREHYLQNKS